MYYDPLGRVVKTVNPDNSQQRLVTGIPNDLLLPPDLTTLNGIANYKPTPWISFNYDANDLAPLTNPTGSNVPSDHYYTPKSSEIDPLGRTIKTTEYFDNSNYANTIEMNYQYDVRGNLLLVKDTYDREVFTHVYDLRTGSKDQPPPPLKTVHIDKGESTILFDATGKPIEGHDAKGAMTLSAYDILHRPNNSWARNSGGTGTPTLRNYVVYGDALVPPPPPSTNNLNGKVIESYDEAGMLEFPLYDFKGNILTKTRKVIDDSVLMTALGTYSAYVIDWDSPPALLSMVFTSDMQYDALNRITELELPLDLDTERKKIIPTYNTAGALEKVDLYSPAGGGTTANYVDTIAYNAKGQRLLISFGNGMMTRYTYDPITFRLLRQRTEGYNFSQAGSTITYAYSAGTNKQDDGFNFDLIGNIVKTLTRVTDCGITGSVLGADGLDRVFEYDPIYRLTYADGREADTQSGADNYIYTDAPDPGSPNASNVRYYERQYTYDKLGNVEQVKQLGTNGFTRDFTYNTGVNTLQKIEDASPTLLESYTYDANGNQLNSNLNRHHIWNHSDQLICYKNQISPSAPTVFTQYDYSGQDRVSKMVRTGTDYERTIYIDGIFEYCWLDNGTFYEKNYIHIMDDKSRIAEVRINPGTAFPGDITDSITYNIEDQIGSSVVRLNTSGTVIDREEYYPFGDSSLRTFIYKRYRYVGKERDSESGLYYYGARYYSAWTCRFISVDPLAVKYNQLTPYNYAGNDPINDYDIDGMQGTKTPNGGNNSGSSQETNTDQLGESTSNVTYKGGIQIYEAAEAKGGVPGGQSKASESFKVGDYDVLPNYIKEKNGDLTFSHYTASIIVNQVKPGGGTEQVARIDYVFGKADLQAFKDKALLFATAANIIFGADTHLTKGKIEMLNGNGAGTYVKELYTSDPVGTAFAFTLGFYGLIRGQYFKPNGGKDVADFIGHGAEKHKFNPLRRESRSSSQFGRDIDVAKLTEHTMKYGIPVPKIDELGNLYATKYMADFGFNIGTKTLPTDAVRVFINHVDAAATTVFPYIKR